MKKVLAALLALLLGWGCWHGLSSSATAERTASDRVSESRKVLDTAKTKVSEGARKAEQAFSRTQTNETMAVAVDAQGDEHETVAMSAATESEKRPADPMEKDPFDVADAPRCSRYPNTPVRAYRASVLPPKTKGGPEGELREWLVKPNEEGYEHHLEETWYPNEAGEMVLAGTQEYVANQVTVTVDGECTDEQFAKLLEPFGAKIHNVLMEVEKGRRLMSVMIPADEATLDSILELTDALNGVPSASDVSRDYVIRCTATPNDARWSSLWGMTKIKAAEAWGVRTDASSVLVGVMDTGINYTHEDLAGNMWRNPQLGTVSGWTNDLYGVRCLGGVRSGNVLDGNGHGSHVAGTIGAVGNNSKGVAGVAWRVKLVALKALDDDGNGYVSDVIPLLDYARRKGIQVVNCSFGSDARGYSASVLQAFSSFRASGGIAVCAAGNSGENNDSTPHYPSSYNLDNIVAVAASTSSDILRTTSCYGATSVDIAAPGENVVSCWKTANNAYLSASGTSMAAPHVTGALALLKAQYPNETYLQLIQRLYAGVDKISALSGKVKTGGRLNVLKALSSATLPAPAAVAATRGTYTDKVVLAWYRVTGATHYQIYRATSSTATPSAISSWISFAGSTNTVLGVNDTSAIAGTTYYYYVKAASSASGANASPFSAAAIGYRATATATYPDEWDPDDNTPSGGTVITPTTTVKTHGPHGLNNANDRYDFFKVSLTAGKKYQFETTGSTDTYGELFNSTSTNTSARVAYNDDGGSGNNFLITYTPTTSGTYYLRVRRYAQDTSAETYSYTLRYQMLAMDAWDPADDVATGATLLTPTATAQTHGPHSLSSADSYDFFKISMTAGKTYVFETVGTGDTYGELFSSTSTNSSYRVAYDDDGGTNRNFKIAYTPTKSQTYYLRVRAYSVGSALDYSLKYRMVDSSASTSLDLTFCKPSTWSSFVVLSGSNTNALSSKNSFTTNEGFYIHYGYCDRNDYALPAVTNKIEISKVVVSSSRTNFVRLTSSFYLHEALSAGKWMHCHPTDQFAVGEAGTYRARVYLDSENMIRETNENNNTYDTYFTVVEPTPSKTLTGLSIAGPSRIDSGTSTNFTTTASYSDGTTARVNATWSASPADSIVFGANGAVRVRDITADEEVTLTALYTENGVTKSATKRIALRAPRDGQSDPYGVVNRTTNPAMVVYAEVSINGVAAQQGDVLLAFVGNELRGRIELDARGRRAINVYLNDNNEKITFKVWSDGDEHRCNAQLQGEIGRSLGEPSDPYLIDCASSNPFGTAVAYPNPSMTIVASVTIRSEAAAQGDMVGVFCGSELRGTGVIRVDNGVAKVTLSPSVAGTENETFTFKVWDVSEDELLDAQGSVRAVVGGQLGSPSARYAIVVSDTVTQTLTLNGSDWQFMSINVVPTNSAPRVVFGTILNEIDRVICDDVVFKPTWDDEDNTLAEIESGKGYWVKRKTSGRVQFAITGMPADVTTVRLSLTAGWNAIGYVPQQPGSIREVFANALNLGVVESVQGDDCVFYPAWDDADNTLSVMRPGSGYWVRATRAGTFTFVNPSGSSAASALVTLADEAAAGHPFGDIRDNDDVEGTIVLRAKLNLFGTEAVSEDAYVAAYVAGSDIPCAVVPMNMNGNVVMSIMKYTPFTLTFKVWDAHSKQTYTAETTISYAEGEDEKLDETIVVSGETPMYTVVFETDGLTGGTGSWASGGSLTQTVSRLSAAIAPTVKAALGYEFLMWDTDFASIKCDMIVHAVYRVAEAPAFDSADPKDDTTKGAVNWTLKSTRTSFARTLRDDDPADNFKITGKDGLLYDIALEDATCDAVFSITNANGQTIVSNVTSARRIVLPKTKMPYYLTVTHGTEAKIAGRYTIAGQCADVGTVKFAKTAVAVKESAAYVELTVNRTGKDGRVRVSYTTADGSAKAGEDYQATSGVLEWANGDKKAKKIRVPFIPDLVAAYDGVKAKAFTVRLAAIGESEMAADEYPATIMGGDTCTVTVNETSKEGVTVESVYAKQSAKRATVKKDEDVPLSSGTFFGVVEETVDEHGKGTLTNGLPKLASITFTASAAATPALSAKVAIGGKTYAFSVKGWDDAADGGAPMVRTRTLVNVQRAGKIAYTNTLTVAVRDGATTDWDVAIYGDAPDHGGAAAGALGYGDAPDHGGMVVGAWPGADATVELMMNVPDAKGKSFQTGVRYAGALYRQNAKIQAYLDAALKFAGYYTVALVADGGAGRPALPDGGTDAQSAGRPALPDGGTDAQSVGRDVPVAPNGGRDDDDGSIGNGYLTLTLDNKGNAKVAGMLANGATKPSAAPKACAVVADGSSANGLALLVPVHFAKGTVCFGGTLRLYAVEDASNPDGSGIRIVADAANLLAWYDDSAVGCVAIHGDGKGIPLAPCGGWYDKVLNLQRHYLDYALSVEAADIAAFPADELPDGYRFVEGVSPDGFALALENDKVVYDKKKIVKTNRLTDFMLSTNVCNVSVKLVRATGLVTGGFSLWGERADGAKQKELTGFKAYGVLLLARDPAVPLDDRIIAPGFATKKVKTTYFDEKGRKKALTWSFSTPFNIVGE